MKNQKTITKSRFKVGDVIYGRVIVQVIHYTQDGKNRFQYGYRWDNEPSTAPPLWCIDTTMYRYYYDHKDRIV